MSSMASPSFLHSNNYKRKAHCRFHRIPRLQRIVLSQSDDNNPHHQIPRSGKKPEYLGVQKNPLSLALCPATNNCISTSENVTDLTHYAPPWNYNGGRNRKNPVTRQVAMEELLQVIQSTKPEKYTPKIVEKKDDYLRVEYRSPILGFVDDVEFWFPPGKNSTAEYRSASWICNCDIDANRKRIKALRRELEKKGRASAETF